jgi:hypothetical protein
VHTYKGVRFIVENEYHEDMFYDEIRLFAHNVNTKIGMLAYLIILQEREASL